MTRTFPMTLDPAGRDRAIAYVTRVVDGYEAELREPPSTDVGIARQAILRDQLPAWRRRLSLLAGVAVPLATEERSAQRFVASFSGTDDAVAGGA